MQVVFHIGAHCTGQDRLIRSLLKNRDMLSREGVAVPGPGRYRQTIDEAVRLLHGARAAPEAEDVLLETVLDSDETERLILSNPSFICLPAKAIEHGMLYPRIGRSAWLRNAFPSAEPGFALTLRNVATFLPALYDSLGGDELGVTRFLGGADPRELVWSEVVEALCEANPGAPVLVWCDEDAPILWTEIMREITGIGPLLPLEGGEDLTRDLLSEAGNARLSAALYAEPPDTEAARRRIVEDVLEDYADDAEVVQEITLPGWTDDLVAELTEAYDEDVERIGAMPGVTLLTP